MDSNNKSTQESFSAHLHAVVKLEYLQKITDDLDKELRDSQIHLNEIKTQFGSIPTNQQLCPQENELRHEDLSAYLAANIPQELLPDMLTNTTDVDVDNIIASMNGYAEDLRKNFVVPQQTNEHVHRDINNVDLAQYAIGMDKLGEQLGSLKLTKQNGLTKNVELERKLAQLCDNVNMFIMMMQDRVNQGETNQNWGPADENITALRCDNMINRLILCMNEVSFLLKNRN